MHTAIHFCSATFKDNIELTPIHNWGNTHDNVMFVVRTNEQLTNEATIQLVADNNIVWSSSLREVPDYGISHEYKATDDATAVYISGRIVKKTDIVVETSQYSVCVVNDGVVLAEIPLQIEFFAKEEELPPNNEMNYSNIEKILELTNENMSSDWEVEIEEIGTHAHLDTSELSLITEVDIPRIYDSLEPTSPVVENESEQSSSLAYVKTVESSVENPVTAMVEMGTVEEEIATPMEYTNELQFDDEIVGKILVVAATQKNYEITHSTAVNKVDSNYEIIIEKNGNEYIAVINDPSSRPMFFLENGQFMKAWEGDFTGYIEWLKEQLSLMFNIPMEESSTWNVLLITDEVLEIEDKINVLSREVVLHALQKYAAIFDVTASGSLLILHFTNGSQLKLKFNELSSLEASYEVLANYAELLESTYILPTGVLAEPTMLAQLTGQFKNASKYRRTSLAWEFVMQAI